MQIGSAATARLQDRATHGKKQQQADDVAKEFGLTRQSLRNLLSAYSYTLSKRDDMELHSALSSMSYAGIEAIRRWSTRSPNEARKFAIRAAKEALSVREVLLAEKRARAPAAGLFSHSNPAVESKIVDILNSSSGVREHLEGLGLSYPHAESLSSIPIDDEMLQAFGVSRSIASWEISGIWSGYVGLIEVEQRENVFNFKKDAKAILTRAVAASTAFPMVVVVLPGAAAMTAVLGGMSKSEARERTDSRRFPTRKGAASPSPLLIPSGHFLTEQWAYADAWRPVFFRPSRIAGAVIFLDRQMIEAAGS